MTEDSTRSGGAQGFRRSVVRDARRPRFRLALGEVAVGSQARIEVTPALDVHEVLRAGQDGAAAHTLAGFGGAQLALEARRQLTHHTGRDAMALARIDEAEHHEMRQENAPVVAEARHQARPVDALGRRAQDVRDVTAVEPLALHDERLGPDHLLGRDQTYGMVEHGGLDAVAEPVVVDRGHPVARAEDHVDEVVAAARLAEPVGERQLRLAAGGGEDVEHPLDVARMHEDVEVLRVPRDARVALERVGAAHEKRHLGGVEGGHGPSVKVTGLGREMLAHGTVAPAPTPLWTPTGAAAASLVGAAGTSMIRNGG